MRNNKTYDEELDAICMENEKCINVGKIPNYIGENSSNNDESFKNNVEQWSINGTAFVPTSKTSKTLPSGYYTIEQNQQVGYYFSKQVIKTNKLYRLPNAAVDSILNDIDKFWSLKPNYEKYNRVYRRNYLLYSAPGTGKTSLINLMCNDLIEKYNGVIVSLRNETDIYLYHDIMKLFREIEPDRKMIVIIEDIDNFTSNGMTKRSSLETTLLNILDGNFKFDNTVIIATTNYPEDLADRYVNRPSRFDKVIEFPLPDFEGRKMFIINTVKEDDLSKIDLDKWCKKTEKYTIDHLNELILLFFVFGHSEEESFEMMDNMINKKGVLKNSLSLTKKKIGLGD